MGWQTVTPPYSIILPRDVLGVRIKSIRSGSPKQHSFTHLSPTPATTPHDNSIFIEAFRCCMRVTGQNHPQLPPNASIKFFLYEFQLHQHNVYQLLARTNAESNMPNWPVFVFGGRRGGMHVATAWMLQTYAEPSPLLDLI